MVYSNFTWELISWERWEWLKMQQACADTVFIRGASWLDLQSARPIIRYDHALKGKQMESRGLSKDVCEGVTKLAKVRGD